MKIKIDKYYKYCVNCHKYSNGKPFCKYCYERYYNISDSYKNDITHKDPYVDKIIYKKEYQENIQKTCAYCGNNSNNNEFCDDCFNKYFNYESPKENINKNIHNGYKLKNGITVRSKSELLIGNYLLKHHIKFDYESPLTYSSYHKPLKPDFYIKGPHLFKGKWIKDVYIEHLGGANSNDPKDQEKYKELVKYKMPIYEEKNITLICTYEDDIIDLETNLARKLKKYTNNKINYLI